MRVPRSFLLLAVTVCAAGCDALLVEPTPGPEASFAFGAPTGAPAVYGDLLPILERVDVVDLRFQRQGQFRDTTVASRYEDGRVTLRVALRPEEIFGWLDIQADLGTAEVGVLFRGRTLVLTYGIAPAAEVTVDPVAALVTVTPLTHTFTSLADTLPMSAEAEFATGDVIDGAPIAWTSLDPQIVDVLADGRVIPRANGTAAVRASSLGATHQRPIQVRQSVAQFTGFGPSDTTVAVNSGFVLRPFGQDPGGFPLLPGANVPWTAGGSVSVGAAGTVLAHSSGAGWVEAVVGGVTHHTNVTVTP